MRSNNSINSNRRKNNFRGMLKDRKALERQELEDANRQLIEYAEALNRTISDVKIKNEQLRALALELSSIEERERGRIAEDIHDHIGQTLAMARVKLQELSKSEGEACPGRLDDIEDLIHKAISYSRSMMFEISPNALLELGLVEAIEWLIEYIHGKHDLDIRYSLCTRTSPLDSNVKFILFKAVRELLINVVKHAQTDMAEVTVENVSKGVRVTVQDHGCGFDPSGIVSAGPVKMKFGLFNLQQRIENSGGKVDIDSSTLRGTRVSITLPAKTMVTYRNQPP